MPFFTVTEEYIYQRRVIVEADTEEEVLDLYDAEPDNYCGLAREAYTHQNTTVKEIE